MCRNVLSRVEMGTSGHIGACLRGVMNCQSRAELTCTAIGATFESFPNQPDWTTVR